MEQIREILGPNNIDKIKDGSLFNNKSLNGFSTTILKSAICKYYRRKDLMKFEWSVVEMSLFSLKNNTGIITNLINRLKILLMEDLCPSEIDLIIYGLEKLEEFENTKDISLLINFCRYLLNDNVKRCRVVSYVNCFYKNHKETKALFKKTIENSEITDKIKKFKKDADSEKLLKLGSLLIECLEKNDENIFQIFNEMCRLDEKAGIRYRRKDPVYLYWAILESFITNDKLKIIFDFALKQFFRKEMKERFAFGIWIGLIYIRRSVITDWPKIRMYSEVKINYQEYFGNRPVIVMDDFVINDYHVSKTNNLETFAKVGALVVDEDNTFMDPFKMALMKNFYIETKTKESTNKVSNNETKVSNKEEIVENKVDCSSEFGIEKEIIKLIPFERFQIIKVNEDGVCGGKVMCLFVIYKGLNLVLKEMRPSFNLGLDYICMDKMKYLFNLINLNMSRIKTNKHLERKDLTINTLKGNWVLVEKPDIYYCMMVYYKNKGTLVDNKGVLKDLKVLKEMLLIRFFNGLFNTSDNILRNILVSEENNLISIDQNDMFGKRTSIFDRNDYVRKIDKEIVKGELDLFLEKANQNQDKIENIMIKYGFKNYIIKFNERLKNYKNIVYKELEIV